MKQTRKRRSRLLLILYRSLTAVFLVLALVYLGGTVYGLFFRKTEPPSALKDDTARTFTGIGRLRLPTADSQPATVILSVTFPYSPEDRAFSEELASRVGEFRAVTAGYFKSLSVQDLREKAEESLKAELLDRYNGILMLGKIESLYFNDYMIID
jgi:flagellar basal body-associated protein FliL